MKYVTKLVNKWCWKPTFLLLHIKNEVWQSVMSVQREVTKSCQKELVSMVHCHGIWMRIWWSVFEPRHLQQPLTPCCYKGHKKNYSQPGFKASIMIDFARHSNKVLICDSQWRLLIKGTNIRPSSSSSQQKNLLTMTMFKVSKLSPFFICIVFKVEFCLFSRNPDQLKLKLNCSL